MATAADFDRAYRELIDRWESPTLHHNPDDPGGMTYYGIARTRWPQWPGWSLIDESLRQGLVPARDPKITALVPSFYGDQFWNPLRCPALPSPLAIKLFMLATNMGHQRAVALFQHALTTLGVRIGVDGAMGPLTLSAIMAAPLDALMTAVRAAAGGYYLGLIAANPKLAWAKPGWLARARA